MTDEDDRFDVDRALGRLARRVAWLRWGALGGLVVCAGLAWWAAGHVALIASDPLHPVVSAIDIPPPTLNASGTLERGFSATERALAVFGSIVLLVIGFAYRVTEGMKRYMVLGGGAAMAGLVVLAQWGMSGDQQANRDIERLASAGAYKELWSRTRARPQMPYANYIGAQALLMAGESAQLKAEYLGWLQGWSLEGARAGFFGDRKVPAGVPQWEGSHASPQVMRALEIAVFGNEVTPFARPYLRETLGRLAYAKSELRWQLPVLLLGGLLWVGVVVTWRRARRNLRLAEQWVVRFDYYQSAPAAPAAAAARAGSPPSTLPPIDFPSESRAVR